MHRRINAKRFFLFCLAAAAVILLLVLVIVSRVFVVRSVVIQGDVEDQDEIIRSAKLSFGSSVFSLDEDTIRRNLQSSGTYVLEELTIQYPNTVILSVRERTQDAVVRSGGQYLLLDSEGYVIKRVSSYTEDDGVYVYGLEATSYTIGSQITAPTSRLEAMRIVLEALRDQDAVEYVSELNIEDLSDITLTTRTGITVELGDTSDMDMKIAWMKAAVADLVSRGSTSGTLDVSSGTKADYTSE